MNPFATPSMIRHWRGELSLGTSLFVHVLLLDALIWGALSAIETITWMYDANMRLSFFAFLLVYASLPVLLTWQLTGAWRSAHAHRMEKPVSAGLVKAAVAVTLVLAAVQTPSTFSRAQEFTGIALATGDDAMPRLTLRRSGRELNISGGIAFGLTEKVREIVARHPGITIISLDSPGGRVREARLLRNFIKQNHFKTFSAEGCMSACTIVFLAGSERILYKEAGLGFHKSSFNGASEGQLNAVDQIDKAYMIHAGVDKRFADKAFSTASTDMWFPSHDELIASHYVTRLYHGVA